MKVSIYTETIGSEILKAIQLNRQKKAKEFNVKQAQKYLKEMQKTGDKILIDYAQKRLNGLL